MQCSDYLDEFVTIEGTTVAVTVTVTATAVSAVTVTVTATELILKLDILYSNIFTAL